MAAGPPQSPQRLDLFLEGVAAFQEGAADLKAGDPLCLQPLDGRLACAKQSGAVVGYVPADKRGLLSRGPWSGTVRSVKRQQAVVAAPAAAAGGQDSAAEDPAAAAAGQEQQQEPQAPAPQQCGAAAAASDVQKQEPQEQHQGAVANDVSQSEHQDGASGAPQQQQQQTVVMQVLVRFTPEEQRWAQRGTQEGQGQQIEEEDTARLSTDQLQALGERVGAGCCCACRHGCACRLWCDWSAEVNAFVRLWPGRCYCPYTLLLSTTLPVPSAPLPCPALPRPATPRPAADCEEVRWMLRDERLQKVVAEIDGAPDRERVSRVLAVCRCCLSRLSTSSTWRHVLHPCQSPQLSRSH